MEVINDKFRTENNDKTIFITVTFTYRRSRVRHWLTFLEPEWLELVYTKSDHYKCYPRALYKNMIASNIIKRK